MEEKPGTKQKPSQIETGDSTGRPASVPLMKAKTTQVPTKTTSTHVAPCQNSASATPRQKPAGVTPRHMPTGETPQQKPAAPSQNPVAATSHSNKSSKKCTTSLQVTDNAFPEDPKTPTPPLKKPRINRDAHQRILRCRLLNHSADRVMSCLI